MEIPLVKNVPGFVVAGLCVASAAVAARSHESATAVVLSSAVIPAKPPGPGVKAPDTPAGRALTEFVDSFKVGGKTRQTWLETRTLVAEGPRAHVLKTDAQLLQQYGPLTVVRIVSSSQEFVAAVVRHGTSHRHGYLTITVKPTAPFKVVNFGMRPASSEEVQGSVRSVASVTGKWERLLFRSGRE